MREPASFARLAPPIVLPYAMLKGDNHRLIPAKIGRKVRLIANPEYREAKDIAKKVVEGMELQRSEGRVALACTFHFPDLRRRDVTNYGKFICDTLTGIAFVDDEQIDDARYIRGYVDRKNPRVEITLTGNYTV